MAYGLTAKAERARKEAKRMQFQKKAAEKLLMTMPTYQTPEEAKELKQLTAQTAEDIRGLKEYGQESLDIAKTKTGMEEMPGIALAKENIQQATAQTVQSLIESGGGMPGLLGAIGRAGRQEQAALRDLAAQNMAYQEQADAAYQSALTGQAQLESGLLSQSAALESAGLQTMIGEKEKEFGSKLNKRLTGIEYLLGQSSTTKEKMAQEEAARQAKNAALVQGLFTVAGSALGGPLGGALGKAIGGTAGTVVDGG